MTRAAAQAIKLTASQGTIGIARSECLRDELLHREDDIGHGLEHFLVESHDSGPVDLVNI